MNTFIFFLGLTLSLTLFQTNTAKAENRENASLVAAKIINGETSRTGDWPWMAAILSPGYDPFLGQYCGGTLIAPQWVLTAAHCVDETGMDVLLGQNDLESNEGEIISVDKFVIHPDYQAKSNTADIALLHLDRPSFIQPVSLANNFNFQAETGKHAIALGWGITFQGVLYDDFPSKLQQVNLDILSNSICDTSISPAHKNIICLGILDNKDTCSGDSGGPLIIFNQARQQWNQIGITSFGPVDCAMDGRYTAYTQVDRFMSFINSTLNSTKESPEEFLAKCADKYSDYLGEKEGGVFVCENNSKVCLNTTGGDLNITQISVLRNNPSEILEYFIEHLREIRTISYTNIGYCK
jgi:secreted trypsin-like serine protease